jgi:hypothetical protein
MPDPQSSPKSGAKHELRQAPAILTKTRSMSLNVVMEFGVPFHSDLSEGGSLQCISRAETDWQYAFLRIAISVKRRSFFIRRYSRLGTENSLFHASLRLPFTPSRNEQYHRYDQRRYPS